MISTGKKKTNVSALKRGALFLTVLTLLCAASAPARAQIPPRVPILRGTGKISAALRQASSRLQTSIKHALHIPILPAEIARLAATSRRSPALDSPIRQRVLPILDYSSLAFPKENLFVATSFVIEEEFQGKKFLWGVTAAHIAELVQPAPAVFIGTKSVKVRFAVHGHSSMADLAIFPLPEELKNQIAPLKLAKEPLHVGEKTYSFGFFDDDFYLVPDRTVTEITPNRFLTSLEFKTKRRNGACGGPLLNANGEVVGVHVGSSNSKQVSFAVPASQIIRLLRAYRNGGEEKQIFFNGVNLGRLPINENIYRLRTFAQGRMTGEITTRHHEKELDYARLETILADKNPEELQLTISHQTFSPTGNKQEYFFNITHNFITNETTRSPRLEVLQ